MRITLQLFFLFLPVYLAAQTETSFLTTTDLNGPIAFQPTMTFTELDGGGDAVDETSDGYSDYMQYQYSYYIPFSMQFGVVSEDPKNDPIGYYFCLDWVSNNVFNGRWEDEDGYVYEKNPNRGMLIWGIGGGAIYSVCSNVHLSAGMSYLYRVRLEDIDFGDDDEEDDDDYYYDDYDYEEDINSYDGIRLNASLMFSAGPLIISAGGNLIYSEKHSTKTDYCFGLGVKF